MAIQHFSTTKAEPANIAIGNFALYFNTYGSGTIALGDGAGQHLSQGGNNIYIGNPGGSFESNTIRIGDPVIAQFSTYIAGISGTAVGGVPVVVTNGGQLGVAASSSRFKDQVTAMDKASEAILAVKPVSFYYKKEIDPERIPQFGLIAEEVQKISPDLVVRDKVGKPFSVRYEAVNAMLLNEFLKEHKAVIEEQRKVQEQEKTIAELKSGMTALAATVKEQAAQIQKVSAQVEASKPASQVVNNNQ